MLHRQSRRKSEPQLRMRLTQSRFYLRRRIPARKNKSQVTRPLRPSRHVIPQPRSNLNLRHPRQLSRLLNSLHPLKNPALRHGNHHHALACFSRVRIPTRHSQRITQQQLFERNFARAKSQRPRTQPANRPRRNFQHPRPIVRSLETPRARAPLLIPVPATACPAHSSIAVCISADNRDGVT